MNPPCFSQLYLCLCLPSNLFPSGFLTKTCTTICLILLDLITLIIFGVKHKPWKSSLCSLLQSPVTSSSLGLRPKQEGETFLRNISNFLPSNAASHPRRLHTVNNLKLILAMSNTAYIGTQSLVLDMGSTCSVILLQ
jgi:hypothetical protein